MSNKMTDYTHQLKLDNQLCFAAYACSREIIKLYRPFLDKLNLTYTQYITMLVLWETSPITAKNLGERLYLDSGTLTPLLKKLEKQGFLNRKRSSEDERLLLVTLTEEGQALKEKVKMIPYEIACGVGLEAEEGIALRETLQELTKQIQNQQCVIQK
jgi:DNA-binding MarR family transcriptional regulator